MIKNLMLRGLPWIALCTLPLLASAPVAHSAPASAASGAAASSAEAARPTGVRAPLPLFEAIDRLPVAAEHREGYKRDLYKHWNRGLNAGDGCDTRKEVILAEAVVAPQVAAGCKLTGGSWRSAYDDVVVTDAARLDVDHFVSAPATDRRGFWVAHSVSGIPSTVVDGVDGAALWPVPELRDKVPILLRFAASGNEVQDAHPGQSLRAVEACSGSPPSYRPT
ncbi:hypothetical protein ACFXD5_38580 [Streptomyces sp. NPDC059385]|uniref:hypothetical protein n=1 Tax=Streptomyces sp. NPDC059385 TaxID=3346817 RepID=UPI0036920550